MAERKPKPKTLGQLRNEALRAQSLDALRQRYPETAIDFDNIASAYSTGAWNNGSPRTASLPGLSISLSAGTVREVDNSNRLPAVYVYKKDLERLQSKPNGLLLVHFGMDDALTFTPIPMRKTYRVTVHDKYVVPVEDLRFLATFVDPTTEMQEQQDDARHSEAEERFRRVEETIETNELKLGDRVVWKNPETGESIDYGTLCRTEDGGLMVQGSKKKYTTYVDTKKGEVARRCFARSK